MGNDFLEGCADGPMSTDFVEKNRPPLTDRRTLSGDRARLTTCFGASCAHGPIRTATSDQNTFWRAAAF